MGKPYSNDLRERVVAAIEAGHTRVEVAELYNMALSTVGGFIKRKRETGSVRPDKFGGYKTFALEDHTAQVKELVAEQPDSSARAAASATCRFALMVMSRPRFRTHRRSIRGVEPTIH